MKTFTAMYPSLLYSFPHILLYERPIYSYPLVVDASSPHASMFFRGHFLHFTLPSCLRRQCGLVLLGCSTKVLYTCVVHA